MSVQNANLNRCAIHAFVPLKRKNDKCSMRTRYYFAYLQSTLTAEKTPHFESILQQYVNTGT